MNNLLRETVNMLAEYGRTPDDVSWVGSRDGKVGCSWDHFAVIADVNYDSGFGSNYVPLDVVVVGRGWWLERLEYDGSEGWEYREPPVLQQERIAPTRIIPGRDWGLFPSSLADAQNEEET